MYNHTFFCCNKVDKALFHLNLEILLSNYSFYDISRKIYAIQRNKYNISRKNFKEFKK